MDECSVVGQEREDLFILGDAVTDPDQSLTTGSSSALIGRGRQGHSVIG